MKDKNGIQICCENCACEQCGLNTYEHWRQACMKKDFADFNPSQTAYEKRIAELEAIDEKNTANLRRFQATLIEWKDKNNELSRKNSELEAELTQLKDGKSHVVGVEIPEGYLEEAFKNVAPVAKPIVWEENSTVSGLVDCTGAAGIFNFNIRGVSTYHLMLKIEGYTTDIFPCSFGEFWTPSDAKEAAQDWLNKLVADMSIASTCPENVSKNGEDLKVSENSEIPNNPTCKEILQVPQFTAEEIDGIRKLAQFSGFMIANSIIAKCDAILKGGRE